MDWCDENSKYRKSTYGVSCCQLAEASQGGTMDAITFLLLAAVNYVAMGEGSVTLAEQSFECGTLEST